MPLSKAKDRERKRKTFQPNSNLNELLTVIPKPTDGSWSLSNLSHPVFGQVKSKYYARQFLDSLGCTQS